MFTSYTVRDKITGRKIGRAVVIDGICAILEHDGTRHMIQRVTDARAAILGAIFKHDAAARFATVERD